MFPGLHEFLSLSNGLVDRLESLTFKSARIDSLSRPFIISLLIIARQHGGYPSIKQRILHDTPFHYIVFISRRSIAWKIVVDLTDKSFPKKHRRFSSFSLFYISSCSTYHLLGAYPLRLARALRRFCIDLRYAMKDNSGHSFDHGTLDTSFCTHLFSL